MGAQEDQEDQEDMVAQAALGRLAVTPESGTVGEWGTWTARYTAGEAGMAAGGALRVALPLTWYGAWRNSARAVQATRPAEPYYVAARTAHPEVRLRCEVEGEEPSLAAVASDAHMHLAIEEQFIKRPRPYLDGKARRYSWVVRVTVEQGQLNPGDVVEVLFGDRSGGSRGFTPPLWGRSPELVRAEVDPNGSGAFQPLPEETLPRLRVRSAPAAEVAVILPSTTEVGRPVPVILSVLDANLNPAWAAGLELTLQVAQGQADLSHGDTVEAAAPPAPVLRIAAPLADAWSVRVVMTPRAPGIIRLRAQSSDGRLYALSNPSRCHAKTPAEYLLWGDLHGHTQWSWDATGLPDDAFRYARDVSGLQVYGNADHGESLDERDWADVQATNARYYDPGRFVTLVGYEDTLGFPYGHHNVFFRGASGPLRHSKDITLEALWQATEPGQALTIPHHSVALGNPSRPNTDWQATDPRFQRVVEIYSGHGQSEMHAEDHPLASDVVDFTLSGPAAPPSAVQEAWLLGREMGTIASSDNHFARPGRDGYGLAAIYTPALTREAVFDAISQRRTYGTTGCRLLLDFAVNGVPMGGECTLEPGESVRLTGYVVGAAPLRFVEVLRGDCAARTWQVVHRQWFAGNAPLEINLDWQDEAPPAQGLYYLRVRQRDIVHGRVAMGWSSPVWVTR